jgi:hypothetical protein
MGAVIMKKLYIGRPWICRNPFSRVGSQFPYLPTIRAFLIRYRFVQKIAELEKGISKSKEAAFIAASLLIGHLIQFATCCLRLEPR